MGVGVNTHNGDIYVMNSSDHNVSVFDAHLKPVTSFDGMGATPVKAP